MSGITLLRQALTAETTLVLRRAIPEQDLPLGVLGTALSGRSEALGLTFVTAGIQGEPGTDTGIQYVDNLPDMTLIFNNALI